MRKELRETEKKNSWKRMERKENKIFPLTKVPVLTPAKAIHIS